MTTADEQALDIFRWCFLALLGLWALCPFLVAYSAYRRNRDALLWFFVSAVWAWCTGIGYQSAGGMVISIALGSSGDPESAGSAIIWFGVTTAVSCAPLWLLILFGRTLGRQEPRRQRRDSARP